MRTYAEARKIFWTRKARQLQLDSILNALGGPDEGWRGFDSSTEVLSFLRDRLPGYQHMTTVEELVAHLGLDLSAIPDEFLKAAREEEIEDDRKLDEFLASLPPWEERHSTSE